MALPFALQMMIGIGIGVLGILLLHPRLQKPYNNNVTLFDEDEERRRYRSRPGDTCNICFDVMETFDMHFLPCRHAFHRRCFDKLTQNRINRCPSCRDEF